MITILQAYQDDLLRDLDEGEGMGPNAVKRVAFGHYMAAREATEKHSWLNLLDACFSLLTSLATQSTLCSRGSRRDKSKQY